MNDNNKVMLIGNKESFLTRVLLKKMQESGLDAFYVDSDISIMNASWNQSSAFIYYFDKDEVIDPKTVHFLKDKLMETGQMIALIGEKNDTDSINSKMPALIWGTFPRPLDTDKFIAALKRQMTVPDSGSNKRTILVVDDDPTYTGLIRDWLRNYYKVGMANSGLQALQWLGINKADLILLDFEMPISDGPKVLEMLRSDPDTADIPVFFLTSKNDKGSVLKVMAMKPDNYLLKTIERTELLQKLDAFFRNR